jgi:DNA replication protein DnaC
LSRGRRLRAAVEDVDLRTPRGLDRALFLSLADCRWITAGHNLLIIGPTGCGNTWLGCARGHKACRENLSVLYTRLPRLLEDLALARADGRYPKLITTLGRVKLLILDDCGLAPPGDEARRDLLEIVDDRHGRTATLITSQFPVDRWHDLIGDPTLADAILDRLVHNAHRIELKGESVRKRRHEPNAAG